MKKVKLLLFVAALLVFSCSVTFYQAQAQCSKALAGRGGGPMGSQDCLLTALLSQEQRATLNNIRVEFLKESGSMKSDVFAKRVELNTILLNQSPDVEKAMKLQDELSTLQGKLAQKRLENLLKSRKILTPEQIAQLPPGCILGFGCMSENEMCGQGMGGCFSGNGHGCGPWNRDSMMGW